MEEEFDDLLNEAGADNSAENFKNNLKNTQRTVTDFRNVVHAQDRQNEVNSDPYGLDFSKISRGQFLQDAQSAQDLPNNAYKFPQNEISFVKRSSNNSVNTKKVLNENGEYEDFDPEKYRRSSLSALGYNDFLYEAPIEGTENELRKSGVSLASGTVARSIADAASGFLEKFDDGQQYDFLVPSIDPNNGEPILRRVRGTYEDVTKKGYNVLNKFGASQYEDGAIPSLLKSFVNTASETDDLVLSASKYLQDAGLFVTGNSDVDTKLDDVYEDTIKDTQRTSVLMSDESNEFGTLDWFASGTGSGIASVLQFGYVGRGLRGGVAATEGLVKAIGWKGFKSVVADKVATYGSSGVIGFGYGYKEALSNGLDEKSALLYGTLTGLVNTVIETKLGASFDRYLTGGGPQVVAKEILQELDGKVTTEGMKDWVKKRSNALAGSVGSRFSNMASEGTEEVLQDIVEQGAKLAYNATFTNNETEVGQGKFNQREYDFMQTVASGIFGAVAAAPFNSTGNKMAERIYNGESKDVKEAIELANSTGNLSKDQYNSLKTQFEIINNAYNMSKSEVNNIAGEYADQIKKEALNYVSRKIDLNKKFEESFKDLKDNPQAGEQRKEEFESITRQMEDVDKMIASYGDINFIRKRAEEIKKAVDLKAEYKDNNFVQTSDIDFSTDSNYEQTLTRIGSLLGENFAQATIARTVREAANVMKGIQEARFDASIAPEFAKQMRSMGYYTSPLINTDENRAALLSLGFSEEDLPMTTSEKVDAAVNPEKYANRIFSLDAVKNAVAQDQTPGKSEGQKYLDYFQTNKLNPAQVASLDNREVLNKYLSSDRIDALNKVIENTAPITMAFTGGNEEARGLFLNADRVLVVSGALDQIDALRAAGASQQQIDSHENNLFHVLVHEIGHAVFNRDLIVTHHAWLKSVGMNDGANAMSPSDKAKASYFDRVYKLALLAHTALKSRPESGKLYFFNKVAPAATQGTAEDTAKNALGLVQEFFAEALSNESFQTLLDSFDLNDPKNDAILKSVGYVYQKPAVQKKESLMSQVIKAVTATFRRLGNVLTREDRTILTEAFNVGTNLEFNKFLSPEQLSSLEATSSLSISNYDGINLFDGEQVDRDQLIASLYRRLEKAGVRLNDTQRNDLLSRIKAYIDTVVFDPEADEFLGGSFGVVYFKATNHFMLMWKTVGESGDQIHRTFFNKYGNREYLNTDINNHASPTTMSKPDVFEAFRSGYQGQEADEKRAVINNLDRAIAERFEGSAWLEYDEDRIWNFEGRQVKGQINVMYKRVTGEVTKVGFAPDLTKARLATIIRESGKITVKLGSAGSQGSAAYVKRNKAGDLVEVYRTNEPGLAVNKYERSFVAPRINFYYTGAISSEVEEIANKVDTITPDNASLEPQISAGALSSGQDILRAGFFGTPKFKGFSLYDNTDLNTEPGTPNAKATYIRNGVARFVRRAMYFQKGKDVRMNDLFELAAEYRSYVSQNPDYAEYNATMGFESEDEMIDFITNQLEDIRREFNNQGNIASEDWNGTGGNPTGRISAAVKADLESIPYEWDGQKHWVDFADVKSIMFEASSGTRSFDDIAANLDKFIEDRIYGGEKLVIAQEVSKHFQKYKDDPDFAGAKNSYWSQFGSYARFDAVTVSPKDESAFVYFNGERSYLDKRAQEMASSIQNKINSVIDALPEGVTSAQKMDALKADMADYFVKRNALKLQQVSNQSETTAVSASEIKLQNKNGSRSNPVNKILSFRSRYSEKDYNTKGYSDRGIMAEFPQRFFDTFGISKQNTGSGLQDYNDVSSFIDAYLAYFGIEVPGQMFEVRRDLRNIKHLFDSKAELLSTGETNQNATNAIKRAMETIGINKYFNITYKVKGSDRRDEHPFVMFAADLVNFLQFQVQNQFEGKKYDYKIGEMYDFTRALMQLEGNYRSSEFYFNAEFEKEWSMKIKSFSDSLVEELSREGGDLLNKYLNNDLYKNNRFLKTIRQNVGQKNQYVLSGIKNSELGKSYNAAGDFDYLYMNLAAFAHNAGASTYLHIDDVPSDKPKNMAFRMARMTAADLKAEVQRIIDTENVRYRIANERVSEALEATDDKHNGEYLYKISNQAAFDDLVPGVHYKEVIVNGEKFYQNGWIFNRKNYFYGGKKMPAIVEQINKESDQSFSDYKSQGFNFPVSTDFMRDLNEQGLGIEEYGIRLAKEQERVFKEWRLNNIINRYHLNQVLMGDYIYYKPDEFTDLNKRHAGTVAPSAKGVFDAPIKVSILKDEAPHSLALADLPMMMLDNVTNKWVINPDQTNDLGGKINKTDAQGYVTEAFASKIQSAYGDFSGYEKVFKPVVYGVNKKDVATGQPIYLKLSLAILPDPANNAAYYEQYPGQLYFATRVYESGADFVTFITGTKVGAHKVGSLSDDKFNTLEIDPELFGLQNNPYKDPTLDDNYISGTVQQTKQLGDNGNYEGIMSVYHNIEGGLINSNVGDFLEGKFNDLQTVRDLVKSRLERNEYSAPIADFIDDEIRVFDNPITSKTTEQMMNAEYGNAVSLVARAGEKLVNVSDLGFGRPSLSESQEEQRREILISLNAIGNTTYNPALRWVGPRRPEELTITQLVKLQAEILDGTKSLNSDQHVIDADGNIVIYPADVLVPAGNYEIGDRVISTRIPTSKKSNSTPGEVAGFIHESQGNLIVMSELGTAIHGYDFDVDGMFVWRERSSKGYPELAQMFDIATSILLHPKNYNDVTSPVGTDNISDFANEIDALVAEGNARITSDDRIQYSKFSPERQLQLKKLNSTGKVMISIAAMKSGVHSVLQQNNGSPYIATENNGRFYLYNNKEMNKFETVSTDEDNSEMYITDIFSEFINAATDNAKLQLLGRINANPVTAPVMFDMLSHGIPMRYAILFINQPVIREYVRLMENQSSASFNGDPVDVADYLHQAIVRSIRNLRGPYANYEFNKRMPNGATEPGSKSIQKFETNQFGKLVIKSFDDVNLSSDSLIDGIKRVSSNTTMVDPAGMRFSVLENQLVVLNKFRYYAGLAGISAKAGKLVSLTSGFPKTYIDLLDTKKVIESVAYPRTLINDSGEIVEIEAPIAISNMIVDTELEGDVSHGTYSVHWKRLNDLIAKYGEFKLYANPAITAMHNDMAAGRPVAVQQKLHDDFYTYLLTQENESDNDNFVYNLSTSSLTGDVIDPYKFVDASAKVIDQLKQILPTNEFLRVLSVKLSGLTPEQLHYKYGEPSIAMLDLGLDPDGDMLARIRSAFAALPSNQPVKYYDVVNGEQVLVTRIIKSTQDLVLGHLLYSKGFSLGGFSFSKLLPTETVKFFDRSVQLVEDRMNNYQELVPIDDETAMRDPSYLDSYYHGVRQDAGLDNFVTQAQMNIPELITEIKPAQLRPALVTDKGHFEQWEGIQKFNVEYKGLMSVQRREDGGEFIVLQSKKTNAENQMMIERMLSKRLVRMKSQFSTPENPTGYIETYRVDGPFLHEGKYTAKYITLESVNFKNFKNVRQYGSLFENELSNRAIAERSYLNLQDETEPALITDDQVLIQPNSYAQAFPEGLVPEMVQNGSQQAYLTPVNENPSIGQMVSAVVDGQEVLMRIKKWWPVDETYRKALARDGDEATRKFLRWASYTLGRNVDLAELLGKNIAEFDYVAKVDEQNRTVSNMAEPIYEDPMSDQSFDVEFTGFSEYNPLKSEGLYKAVVLQAGELFKVFPTVAYNLTTPEGSASFFLGLESIGFDPLQRQAVRDFIDNKSLLISDTDTLANGMINLANSGESLESYNTAVGYDRYVETPIEKLHEVASALFGSRYDDIASNFSQYANLLVDEEIVNPMTNLPYTHYQWLVHHFDAFVREERRFNEIENIVGGDFSKFEYRQLVDWYSEIRQNMGSNGGLIWKKRQSFIQKLGDKIGTMAEGISFNLISNKTGESVSFAQEDLPTYYKDITSVTDFSERQAAMQEIGRNLSIADAKSNAEKLRTNASMEYLMKQVMTHHYEVLPKSFVDKVKFWNRAEQTRDVFEWMLETDGVGDDKQYTGRMISRYMENEEEYRKRAFKRLETSEGRVYFEISNKKILNSVMDNLDGKLTNNEMDRITDINVRYGGYENFFDQYQSFTEEQKIQSGKDTTFIRNMWIKIKVKSEDSAYFAELKRDAANFPDTSKGKLAQAKIDLYDFLYDKSNELLQENGYFNYPVERGLMPQTLADFSETWDRYGFKDAYKEFMADTQDDIDQIETASGLVISAAPVMSFETTKKVPYRTLRRKKNFSVNVPAIFAHHFNTLIFKKHYDDVLPIMDAVHTHYRLQKELGAGNYDTLVKFIEEYADQRIFYKQRDFAKTKTAKFIKLLGTLTVTQFLGLAPLTSAVNLTVGTLETYKHLLGDMGLKQGSDRFVKGMRRLFKIQKDGVSFTRVVSGEIAFDKKAMAVMHHYGIETFTVSEIQNLGSFVGQVQDFMLMWQKSSEIMVRGAAFFAEMTDKQWDAFTLNEDGSLTVSPDAPTDLQVAEWKNKIGSVQGKYDEVLKRLYHGNAVMQAIFLFKGWLIDYIRSRTGAAHFDQFGTAREGYYRTVGRLGKDVAAGLAAKAGLIQDTNGDKQRNLIRILEAMKGKSELSEIEQQNIRKALADLAFKFLAVMMGGLIGAGSDARKKEEWYRRYLSKIDQSLFLLTKPSDFVKMAKNPFASLHDIEQGAKIIDAIIDLNAKEAMDAGYSMLPIRQPIEQIVKPVVDAVTDDENAPE